MKSRGSHRPQFEGPFLATYACLCACLVILVVPSLQVRGSAPRTGTIRGRVELRRIAPPPERRPNAADLGTPSALRDLSDRLKSVVYLESAPRRAFDEVEPGHAVLDQRDERFVPHVLAITTGTIVDFPNSDRIYHNVFSLSKTKSFDLGRYAAGRSKPVKFDRPGVVRVFCDIHSHMNAFVLVFSHPFFSLSDTDGRYRIDNVPPGTYNVIAWNEGVSSEPKPVTVPEGGEAELDFTLR
jgi:plastocyanin